MTYTEEDLVMYCRQCGQPMSMIENRIDRQTCCGACKISFFRKREAAARVKGESGLNASETVTEPMMAG